jgi:glycerol-3-phosphate acyltransferase PlsY
LISLVLNAIIAYLLGSVSGSMLMGRLRGVDIRKSGSGNAGGTNAFRTQGPVFALGVVLIDIGKGALAAGLVPMLNLAGGDGTFSNGVQAMVCGFMAVVGHCFPVWYGFRGGKGAAAAVGALAVIQPIVLVPMFLVWVLTLVATGWVGLSTILASLSLVPAFAAWGESGQQLWFAMLLAAFIIGLHHSNIRRMLDGSESRFDKVRFVNWFGRDGRS